MLAKDGFPDFAEEVKINRFKLEVEAEKQPSIYQYWSGLLAQAKADKDTADDKLDLVKSTRELYIRAEVEKGNKDYTSVGKVSESAMKAFIETDDRVMKAKEFLRKAKELVYILEGAVKSLEHRKDSLDNLTVQWSKGYYAKPDGGPRETAADKFSTEQRTSLNKDK